MSAERLAIQLKNDFSTRIPELDGLRGVAVLLIIFYHYFQQQIGAEPGTPLAFLKAVGAFTWSGIDLFLVLSGFLIGGILFDTRTSDNYFRTFYIRRACRILPPCALFYIVLFGANHVAGESFEGLHRPGNEPIPWWAYATFVQNFWIASHATWSPYWLSITWSLALEEQFYLVSPFVIRQCKRILLFLIILIVSAPAVRVFAYVIYENDFAPYVLTPCRADALALGVLASILLRRADVQTWLHDHPDMLTGTFWISQAGVLFLTTRDPHHTGFTMRTIGYTWIPCFYLFGLLIAVTQKRSLLSRILRLPALTWVGSIAYGSYLLHQAVNGLCHGLILGSPPLVSNLSEFLVTLLAIALTLTLAKLSWVYFESPFIRFGHSYSYGPPITD